MADWSDDQALWHAYLRFNELEARREQAPAEVEQVAVLRRHRLAAQLAALKQRLARDGGASGQGREAGARRRSRHAPAFP